MIDGSVVSQIEDYLNKHYDTNSTRLQHIYNVTKVAVTLARQYKEDLTNVIVASYLHDATKYLSNEENLKLIGNVDHSVPIGCRHAYSAKVLAETKFHIHHSDVLNAIQYHCTGRPNMSRLEQIIFISDYIEEGRPFDTSGILKLAMQDLSRAAYRIMQEIKEYILQSNQTFATITEEALSYYKKELEELDD